MILNELATNATIYEAMSVREGTVEVSWAANPNGWSLHWQERDGPPTAPPSRSGFGARLMANLARQLDGQIAFHWAPEGLSVALTSGRPSTDRTPRRADADPTGMPAGPGGPS